MVGKTLIKKYMKQININVFVFRRDLRIEDNLALAELLEESKQSGLKVLPIFIFNPDQIDTNKNIYFSNNCVEFMIQCLKELNFALNEKLCYFYGKDIEILNKLLTKFQIHTVAFNTDYTPYARRRDSEIAKWCNEKDIGMITTNDYNLMPFEDMFTGTKKPYEIFTPFYKKLLLKSKDIAEPVLNKLTHSLIYDDHENKILKSIVVKDIDKFYSGVSNKHLAVKGGREEALKIMQRITKGDFANYEKYRDFPALDKTTKLSAYMKFGCVSVREVFYTVRRRYGLNHGLLRELIWREFYSHITYNFPRILQGQINGRNHSFKEKYDEIQWGYKQELWDAFVKGRTGFPLVDAGIRQMKTTGYMHNRVRMVVASFLTKDLLIDWRMGEQFFASTLVDYDPSSNSGGWQWASSTGCDSQPYFRIFNSFLQSAKFDPDAQYIKKWIPELKDVPAKVIHHWDEEYTNHKGVYYVPICDHKVQSKKAIDMFKLQ
jgi:deoxyribodipyrimidine photo-lyase